MKNKDIVNFREEISELEQRLQNKMAELKTTKTQLSQI
jgi:hypothetical protein